MLKLAARVSSGETERRAKSERIPVIDGEVVHGVFAVVGVVVASQQTVDLGVDEEVVVQSANAGVRHACWAFARRAADCLLPSAAGVHVKTRHAESVAAQQYFRTNPEAVVAQSTSEELFGHRFWLVFTAVVRLQHVRIRHR